MKDITESRPGQHALVAAGLMFCQGVDDWNFNFYANNTQDEFRVLVQVTPNAIVVSNITIDYPSVIHVLELLSERNEETALLKAMDDLRMRSLEKEKLFVERCCAALQNVAHKVLKHRYLTLWGVRNCCAATLVIQFLEAWGCPRDTLQRTSPDCR